MPLLLFNWLARIALDLFQFRLICPAQVCLSELVAIGEGHEELRRVIDADAGVLQSQIEQMSACLSIGRQEVEVVSCDVHS